MFHLLSATFFLAIFAVADVNGSPYYCTEITTQYSQTISSGSSFLQRITGQFAEIISDSNFTYSAKYSLYNDTTTSYLQIYNITGYDTTYQSSLSKFCYWFFDCTSPITTSPITINLHSDDPFVRIDIDFGTNETFFIDGFFYDNGTLTHWDGTIFSPDNAPCVYDVYTDDGFSRNRTQCCTKFAPGKQVTVNYPKCKRFRSRTIIHNPDFSIYATSSVNYTLAGEHVLMSGDWAGQETFGFELANKFYQSSDPKKQFSLNVTLPPTDDKMFFTTLFVVNDSPIAVQDVIAFIADGNNTLMAEGMPYTKQNDCSYHSFPALRVGVPLPTTVEMCCKEFEN